MPIALSDEQLSHVMRTAQTLHPADRQDFYQRLAMRLADVQVLGDGVLNRVTREVWRGLYRPPPDEGRRAGIGKYR
jgi:hypothetical protein